MTINIAAVSDVVAGGVRSPAARHCLPAGSGRGLEDHPAAHPPGAQVVERLGGGVERPDVERDRRHLAGLAERDHFLQLLCAENGKRVKALTGEALAYFLAYDWPGNVRELRNMIERLVIMVPRDVVDVDDLPAPLRPKAAGVAGEARERSLREAREKFERAYVLAELRANEWNMTRTAERLGIERSHLYRKIKAYGITPPR